MRVCLVIPPSAFLLDDRVFTSLGILRVGAVLESKGIEVDMLDLSGNKNYLQEIERYDREAIFGITATTPQLPSAVAIARELRRRGHTVILGGPHVSLVNAAKKKIGGRATKALAELHEEFDILVAGDGEEAIWQALEMKEGLIDADIPKTSLFLTNDQFTNLPFPARHLVDLNSYHYEIDGERATSLIAQLGCPFECGFCGGRSSAFLRKIRTRSSESVIEELRFLYTTYGYKGFMFHDDELNVNKQVVSLMRQIRQLQDELGVRFSCRGFLKSELITEEQAYALKEAGFKQILVGFESGSPRILKNIKKHATREQNTRCLEICQKYGLKVKALMSIGHPGESEETIKETRQWVKDTHPDDLDYTIIAVYPGTSYYDEAVQTSEGWTYTVNGDRLHSDEIDCRTVANYYKGAPDAYNAFVHTDYLSSRDLVRLRYEAEKEYGKIIPYKKMVMTNPFPILQ